MFHLVFTAEDPIAQGANWTAAADRESEKVWQAALCGNLSVENIISAGVYLETDTMSIQALASAEDDENTFARDYCSHHYPQSAKTANLTKLMSHSEIKQRVEPFAAEASAAKAVGKAYIMGETNSGMHLTAAS